jgi:hypothetical protein
MEIGLTARFLKRLGASFDVVIAMHERGAAQGELICRERAIWVASAGHMTEELEPLPVALSHADCLFRAWAARALDAAGRRWRLAYVSSSLAAVEAIVAQGLAVSVVKASRLAPRLRALAPGRAVPRLPGAEIRFHRAATLAPGAAVVVDHLARRLRRDEATPRRRLVAA